MSRHPVTILARTLSTLAEAAGTRIDIVSATASDWASATFVGACHRLDVTVIPSPSLDAWLAALPETDMALPGHILADLTVRRTGPTRITMSALTLVA